MLATTGPWFGRAGCDSSILVRICGPNRNLIPSVSRELGLLTDMKVVVTQNLESPGRWASEHICGSIALMVVRWEDLPTVGGTTP